MSFVSVLAANCTTIVQKRSFALSRYRFRQIADDELHKRKNLCTHPAWGRVNRYRCERPIVGPPQHFLHAVPHVDQSAAAGLLWRCTFSTSSALRHFYPSLLEPH